MTDHENYEHYDALIVGAGFAGLYHLYHLRQMGMSVRVVDAGSDIGGTWHWNHYPGARVDTHVPNYEFTFGGLWRDWQWTSRFPSWIELRRYFDYVDRKLGLRRDIQLNTRVSSSRFDTESNQWRVQTDQGPEIRAQFMILCTGFAARAYVPEALAHDHFRGECHHTAHWPAQGVDFKDKRVGVIGTGASGVQVIQEVSKQARHLTVFQRTPNFALPMRQRMLDDNDQKEIRVVLSDLGRRRREEGVNVHDIKAAGPCAHEASAAERNAVFEEAWSKGGFHFWGGTFEDVMMDEKSNRLAYDFWRDKIRARVRDPAIAEKLAPTDPPHPFGTVRPSLEQWYYDVFNQDNVTLVDTHQHPIEKITADGVLTSADKHELDVLVLATGFDALTGGLTQIDIKGTQGISLKSKWLNGVKNHLGLSVAGFPNMFVLYGPLSPAALCTGPVCAELQGAWVVNCLRHMRQNDMQRIEATSAAEDAWVQHVAEMADETLYTKANSWYMGANIPGKPRQFLNYGNVPRYLEYCHECEADGYSGFALS